MQFKVVLLLFACIFAITEAQTGRFIFNPSALQIDTVVGRWSDWIFVRTSEPPKGSLTLGLGTDTSGSIEFSASSLSFDPVTQAASFRVKPLITDNAITITFTVSGDASGDFLVPNNYVFAASLRIVTVDPVPTGGNLIKIPSEPKKITIAYPSTGALTITPVATPNVITFVPSTIEIPAGATASSYTFHFTEEFNDLIDIQYGLAGAEAHYYRNVTFAGNYFAGKRTVYIPDFPENVLVGKESGQLYAYIRDYVNSSFSLAIQAADTTFTPSVLEFTPGVQAINFTFKSNTPEAQGSTDANVPKVISFTLSGEGATDYEEPSNVNINVPRGSVSVVVPTVHYQSKESKLSLRISSPVVSDLTVWLFAANVEFNPTNVTFSGPTTAYDVLFKPFAQGPDTISFTLTGTDADWYTAPASVGISIGRGTFLGPNEWYLPALVLGKESDRFPIRATVAPDTSVTLIPTAADLVFTPSELKFTPDNIEQWVTIKPTFSQTPASVLPVSSTDVSFIVTGEQATLYNPPSSFSATILRRRIQIVWSPHIYLTTSNTAVLYLGKHYNVWATASYVDEPVWVTPVSPYLRFEPATIEFTSSNQHVKFTATVISSFGDDDTTSTTPVTYVISGKNGGYYANIPDTTIAPRVRKLTITQAVISPDDRVEGVAVANPSPSQLSSNHIWSIQIQSNALPEGSFSVTPRSAHVKFGPEVSASSTSGGQVTTTVTKTISNGYQFELPYQVLQFNFTLTPLSSGVHDVWFELSGDDAAYYSPPPHTQFSFFIEERHPAELPPQINASPIVVANFALLLLSVVVALLM